MEKAKKFAGKLIVLIAIVTSALTISAFAGNIEFNFTCYASDSQQGVNFYKTASKKDDTEQTFYCTVKNSNIGTNNGLQYFAGAIEKNADARVTNYCYTTSNQARLTCSYSVYCGKGQAVYLMGDSDRGDNYITGIFCA